MDSIERQESLVRMFGCVNAFDAQENLFVISPDRIGFGVIAAPISGISAAMANSLNTLLELSYPTDSLVQFSLYASPDIEDSLHAFQSMRERTADPMLQEITRERIEFLRGLTQRPISEVAGAKLRQLRLMITVQVPNGPAPPTREKLTEYADLRNSFCAAVKATGFAFEPLTADRYLRFMEALMNHGPHASWRSSPWSNHEEGPLLCNQILDPDTAIDIHENRIELGGYATVRILTPKHYPETVFHGLASRYLGDLMKGGAAARDPVLITVNVLYPDHASKKTKIETDAMWAMKNAHSRIGAYVPAYAKRSASLETTKAAIEEGRRVVQAYIGCAVFSRNEQESIQETQETISRFSALGFQMMRDRYALGSMFSQLLPFGAAEDVSRNLMRYRTMTTKHVAPILPVIGSWRGTRSPLLTLIARDGQLMPYSPYNSDGNYNFAIAAESGAGKSYLANNLTTNFIALNGRAWIVDKGYSYKKLCEQIGGQYIEFTGEANLCLNPFPLVRDFAEEVDTLAAIVALMAAPKAGIDDFQKPAIERILIECWNRKGRELLIDDIAQACLAESDERVRDLGHQLFPFTSAGQHGRYFNGPNTVDMNNRLVVLELQQLSGRPHLQRVVLLQILHLIQQSMDALSRDIPKLMLVDEAWSLLATGETKDFIIGWYRQLRKFGASAGVCTQSVNDFYLNEGSAAILENSSSLLLLKQKPASIASARSQGRLELSDWEYKLLETVHTVPGEYSEIFIRNDFGSGVGRLVESPFNNLLYSTRPEDVEAIGQYKKAGLDVISAIRRVLQDRQSRQRVA